LQLLSKQHVYNISLTVSLDVVKRKYVFVFSWGHGPCITGCRNEEKIHTVHVTWPE